MKTWKRLQWYIVPSVFLLSSAFYFYEDILPYVSPVKKIYKANAVAEQDIATAPILELLQALRSNQLYRIGGLFSSSYALNKFYGFYGLDKADAATDGNYFLNTLFSVSIESIEQLSRDKYPDFRFTIEQIDEQGTDRVTWEVTSTFSPYARQYFISDIDINGKIQTLTSSSGIAIPEVLVSPCEPSGDIRFEYVELERRSANGGEEPNSRPPVDLAHLATVSHESFFNTQAFWQKPFEKLVDKDRVPEPGYVLSIADLRAVDMEDGDGNAVDLFHNIDDASGTFYLSNEAGELFSFPTVALMDNTWRRVIVTSADDPRFIALDNHRNPQAVFLLGRYLYVLDRHEVVIYRLGISQGKLGVALAAKSNFGLDIYGASDISGFIHGGQYFLYMAHPGDRSVYQFMIDPATGLPQGTPKRLTTFTDIDGTLRTLPTFSRFECTARSDNQHFMVGINPVGNIAYAFRVENMVGDPQIYLNEATYFPIDFESSLTNIGYNVGEQAYYISDKGASKIHVLSNEGFYLGSGGQPGEGQLDNQFLEPNAISSNTLANDANEILVASKWGMHTGIKRIRPLAGVADLRVVEKAPIFPDDALLNELDFQFSLTAGNNIDKITMSLNGTVIRELTKDNTVFLPKRYNFPFLTRSGPEGIGDLIAQGWNTFDVAVQSTLPGSPLNFTSTKSIEFYYLPSLIDKTFTIDNNVGANIEHSMDSPWKVYKSILVQGEDSITFTLQNGKTIIEKGAVLKFASNVTLKLHNERLEMACGARLQLVMANDYPKIITDSEFDGSGQNYNFILAEGDFTGGQGWGSAPSSMLKIIGCDFRNYLGKAIHVVEGRASVVNSSFVSTLQDGTVTDPDKTAVAIFADPGTRVDVRGGLFKGNDIAMDINEADLVLGHPANGFDNVRVDEPKLEGNAIGVFLNQGTAKITYTQMLQNKAGVFSLDGTLEMDQNSNVTLQENEYGLILSGSATAWKGINRFLDNEVDLYFLIREDDNQTFDFKCNYWRNGSGEGQPTIEYNPDIPNGAELLQVITEPVAEKKGNHFNCHGGSPAGSNSRVMLTLQEANSSDFMPLGTYSLESSLGEVVQEAMAKNKVLSNFLDKKATSPAVNKLILVNEVRENNKRNHHILITQDRLALLDMIVYRKQQSVRLTEAFPGQFEESVDVYPNPVTDHINIGFNFPKAGQYRIAILNMQGREDQLLAKNEFLPEGYHTLRYNVNNSYGIHLLKITNEAGEVIVVQRLIK